MQTKITNFKFYIDRGGTFTDVYAEWISDDRVYNRVLKLLSVDPANYTDAPREAIRRVLHEVLQEAIFADPFKAFPSFADNFAISEIRMGTTIATNALLERKGTDCALLITKGFKDLLEIGYQDRPKIFDLVIKKPELIYKTVIEVEERIIPSKFYSHKAGFEVITKLDLQKLEKDLLTLRESGISSLAVALMHAYVNPENELQIAELAYRLGFTNVSLSSEVMPMIKIVPRGDTTLIDAYLTPLIKDYVANFKSGFSDGLAQTNLLFMKSDAGLVTADKFRGANSILSGPAGGVVGYSAAYDGKQPLIGFDMGGTSTDVSRFAGEYEISFFTELDGLRIQSPQLEINTVAAGGGSRLYFDQGVFKVGPESSGAHPGPVCYRKHGYLSITDANLVLGRLVPEYFPKVFGPQANESLSREAAMQAFAELQIEINNYLRSKNLPELSIEEIALGFINVANEVMARPIREISSMKGYPSKEHSLVCFGGAGGQHACALAKELDISRVIIPRYSGILSAYGIRAANEVMEKQLAVNSRLGDLNKAKLDSEFSKLIDSNKQDTIKQKFLHLRYAGTNTAFMIQEPEDGNYAKSFAEKYQKEFGFVLQDREILVDDIRVRTVFKSSNKLAVSNQAEQKSNQAKDFTQVYFGTWMETPIFLASDLDTSCKISGPAIIMQDTATIVIEPGYTAGLGGEGNIVISELGEITTSLASLAPRDDTRNPILLSIFSSRFMSIAEQMGRTLEKTAISTNIKERRDFSCAIFDKEANLIANAPHQPVHLGSMGMVVKKILESVELQSGDVILTNHPIMGGSHLPDMTVVTPVFEDNKIIFFVANRAHHADIGGITPGSMPSFSTSLGEEGVAVKSFKLVESGIFQEAKLREIFASSRNIEDNISDLRAQVAANKRGVELMQELIASNSKKIVLNYMQYIQDNAEEAIRELLKSSLHGKVSAEDYLDDGSKIKLTITINKDGSAVFDYAGSAEQSKTNLNTPKSVTYSAVLYALRCLINKEIPLNQGCLKPITIIIPENSILNPAEDAAVVAGNVQTSQRIVDVIFKAFQACSASQGCMNNVIFGNENFGYYETIGGGAGACKDANGASAVHTHMTNTRITDPEILESRYPVILREFSIRQNSGGAGKYKGGDGIVREFEFLDNLILSLLTERRVYEPYGLAGGKPGAKGENILLRKSGELEKLAAKAEVKIKPGDRFRILTPGGGGYDAASLLGMTCKI